MEIYLQAVICILSTSSIGLDVLPNQKFTSFLKNGSNSHFFIISLEWLDIFGVCWPFFFLSEIQVQAVLLLLGQKDIPNSTPNSGLLQQKNFPQIKVFLQNFLLF